VWKEMAHAIVRTKWGYIGVVATRNGIAMVTMPMKSKREVEEALRASPKDESEEAVRLSKSAAEALVNYFGGKYDERLKELPVDLKRFGKLQRKVLMRLREVKLGDVVTYGSLAASVGLKNGARVVGRVLAQNPVPFFIPCHRVVRADGKLGGFSFGLELKRRLIEHEMKMVKGEC
jgi:methylated-DNA-[protein]-cysteine S-methyltransferase